ncbi:hypothetical protein HMPREF1377_01555, partial [Enterococcus faecium R494]
EFGTAFVYSLELGETTFSKFFFIYFLIFFLRFLLLIRCKHQ